MTDPGVFYNREDLWTVASEVGLDASGAQTTVPMEPNFVLMRLPGESSMEFVEILPFTPANRNNLIGWIAGRSDGAHYGTSVVYAFPKTKLVDGPMQIEARINPNAQIAEAAKDLADYQRLTAEGKLGEAGQKLEQLKRTLDKLSTRQR